MRYDTKPSMDPALRLTLVNGLAALKGQALDGLEPQKVLQRLEQLFGDANTAGSAMVQQNARFVFNNPHAFERYNLFFRYLRGAVQDLPNRLAEAHETVQALRLGQPVDKAALKRTIALAQALLTALQRERDATRFRAPGVLALA
jgi:hypothetical protein